jgi:hypothetical protein
MQRKKATPSALVARLGSTSLGWVARLEETKLGATSWRMEALAAGFIRFHGIRLLSKKKKKMHLFF